MTDSSGSRAVAGRVVRGLSAITLLALLVTACGTGSDDPDAGKAPATPSPSSASPSASASVSPSASPTPPRGTPSPRLPHLSGRPVIGTAPPPWLGTRVLPEQANGYGAVRKTPPQLVQRRFTLPDRLPALPGAGFASRVTTPAPASVIARSTWTRGCPVAADDLSWLRLAFRGFDHRRHTGELLVNASAADDLVAVFRDLYRARFPIEEMRITRKAELTAPPTGDGNNTGAFACRATTGGTSYSQHAYGLAVDVNPFQNPYTRGELVLPELASSYLDRGWVRPGMITPDGPVVQAFAAIGWGWGGSWSSLKDFQHFSANGR